jgi:hypothetical protein
VAAVGVFAALVVVVQYGSPPGSGPPSTRTMESPRWSAAAREADPDRSTLHRAHILKPTKFGRPDRRLRPGTRSGSVPTPSGSPPSSAPTTQVAPSPPPPTVLPTPTVPAPPIVPPPTTSGAPVGDLPGWHQVFIEDFDSSAALGSFMSDAYYGPRFKRTYPYPWKDTSKNGTYDPGKTLSVSSGVLDTYLHTQGTETAVAAVEPTLPFARGQTYGRYAVRFRADPVPGFKVAWLLWPDSGLRSEGEIDFPEANLDSTIKAFMHHASNDGTSSSLGTQDAFVSSATFSPWHTAVIEWQPGKVTFLLDGAVLGTSTTKVPSRSMHWVLQTETRLGGGAPPATAAGHVQVDWVAAWSYAP